MKLDLYTSTLGYLENELHYFIELSDSNIKENRQIIGLNTAVAISNNDQ